MIVQKDTLSIKIGSGFISVLKGPKNLFKEPCHLAIRTPGCSLKPRWKGSRYLINQCESSEKDSHNVSWGQHGTCSSTGL